MAKKGGKKDNKKDSKKNVYVIITEKPDASRRIADALSGNKAEKKEKRGAFWYEFSRGSSRGKEKGNGDGKVKGGQGERFIVVPAVGHIFALDTVKEGKGWSYPTFNTQWVPSFRKKGAEFSEKYYRNMEDLIKGEPAKEESITENGAERKGGLDASKSEFIVATDYDTEGSVIGYNVLRFLCGVEDARRMKFSTLTKDELIESFENRSAHLDSGQVEAGLTRHYLDFYWGINLTRALTLAMKHAADRGFAILSTGRVQGPTLAMLLEKELEVRKFKSKPFWQLELKVKADGAELVASYEKERIWKKDDAEAVAKSCKGEDAVVKGVTTRRYRQKPPVPFNTTDLQSEAYNQFKYSPRQTLGIAESLYQAGYISYPRSSSQKLPPSINYKRIIEALAKLNAYKTFAEELLKKAKLEPNEGKREDPAHPAVYPTFETADMKKLNSQQKNIYDLIVRRFLAVFGDEALRESSTAELDVGGNRFAITGKRTIEPGWTKFYGKYLAFEEQLLPELKAGQKLKVLNIDTLSKETQPPGRYSQGSILKTMEDKNLGTRATRAEILQTLYDRGYVVGKSIQVTKLGEVVTKVLKDFCPRILSEEMTRKFEQETEDVYKGKRKRDDVVEEAKAVLTDVLQDFKKNEKNIGKKLLDGLVEARKEQRTLGACPNCKVGELRVMFSRFTKKRFVGCSSYFRCAKCGFTRNACKCKCEICGQPKGKCKCSWKEKKWFPSCQTGFPLPAVGSITSMNRNCEVCGFPVIQVWRKGSRPFRMCVNNKCKTKADWGKKKGKKGARGVPAGEAASDKKAAEKKPAK